MESLKSKAWCSWIDKARNDIFRTKMDIELGI